jgi:hypothetical protein
MGMLLMMLVGWVNRHQQDVIMETGVSLVQTIGKCFRQVTAQVKQMKILTLG